MNSYKKWSIFSLLAALVMLVVAGGITVIIDPFFHYHAPLEKLEYPINDDPHSKQRYQNNGIAKNFDYDAVIIGSSMTEDFKASELDELFDVKSIKVPYAAGTYKEINDALARAVKYNKDIKMVVRGLDYGRLSNDKDAMHYDTYPDYLYDDFVFNDVNYIFNKTILFGNTWNVVAYTLDGGKTPDFDEYCGYLKTVVGKDVVLESYKRAEEKQAMKTITEEDYTRLRENIEQNVIALVKENPQIDFYMFFSPHSIYYWDSLKQSGDLELQLELEREAAKMMVQYDNIHLFAFFDEFDMICNPDNYGDYLHYRKEINSQILKWMKTGEHKLTEDNYEKYCDCIYDFYTNYDYESLFKE